ncbi:MAG: BON domain-containing protein [Burkholderiaceae bacterium]|nr:BON domain-containing protein [Burkholderiaceae bacterium]MEB2351739.1 BON domain-containing protein [Burkholderiaceae bacterium]
MNTHARLTFAAALLATVLAAPGCVPLVATGAAVGTLAALDRRTLGAQTEDQEIELRAANRMRGALAQPGGVSVTSYNRKVLLTGQVASEDDKRAAEAAVGALPNVRSVHNELQVLGRPSLATSAADTAITARVKAALLDAQDLHANVIKVITESGTVYLMGLVSRREADRAAQVASRVAGVQRVVTVFEFITEEEVKRTSQPGQ